MQLCFIVCLPCSVAPIFKFKHAFLSLSFRSKCKALYTLHINNHVWRKPSALSIFLDKQWQKHPINQTLNLVINNVLSYLWTGDILFCHKHLLIKGSENWFEKKWKLRKVGSIYLESLERNKHEESLCNNYKI